MDLSDVMYKVIMAVIGEMVDPKSAYIGLRNRVQRAVDGFDAEMAESIRSTDFGLYRKDLEKLRQEITYLPDSLRSTSLFKNRAAWLSLVDFAESMHLDTFAIQAHPLVTPIKELQAVLHLTDEEVPKQYSERSGLPSSFSMGALCLMQDVLDDRLYGSDGVSEAGLKRRARLIAAGGVHSFSKDLVNEERSRALHDVHSGDMSLPALGASPMPTDGTSSVPVDVEAPGSENGSTNPSLVTEPAVPAAPAVAPPAADPPTGVDLANNLTVEEQAEALAAVLKKKEEEAASLAALQAEVDARLSREPMTQRHVQEAQDAERLAAVARLKEAADKVVADKAAADKAAADADAIARADEICARGLPEPGSVGRAAGETGQPSGATRSQPRRGSKKNP